MSDQIWILGATGRSGRGIAELLHATGHKLVLAGRNASGLRALADRLGSADTATGPLDSLLAQLRDAAPAVVVNTVGPFARTSARVIEACPPGTHYVDIANEIPAFEQAFDQHSSAVGRGSTIVTGAGFGVLATESLVAQMCARWPGPARVRVDAIASLAIEEGVIGSALAGSILDGLPDGGRQVEQGRLVRAGLAGQRQRLTTPDGDPVTTSLLPSGDLLAAWRTSGAGAVVSGSAMLPSGPSARVLLPAVSLLARVSVLRRFAIDRLAAVRTRPREMERRSSWGHCAMEWPDGTRREGWLRLGDAGDFTSAATAEVARRLAGQEDVATGAYTPAALFGPSLVVDLGGEFIL